MKYVHIDLPFVVIFIMYARINFKDLKRNHYDKSRIQFQYPHLP